MVCSGDSVPDAVANDKLPQRRSPDAGINESQQPITDAVVQSSQQISDSGIHALHSEPEGRTSLPEQALQEHGSGTGAHISQLDREGSISSIIPERHSWTSDSNVHALQSGREGITPPTMREKASDDGYHWRKYGQKNVKGNEFVRSYYRCSHPSCQVKKQLERSHDGRITDTVYFGEHNHPKPQQNLPLAVGFVVSIVEERADEPSSTRAEDKSSNAHGQKTQVEPVDAPYVSAILPINDVKGASSKSNRARDEVDNDDDPRSKRQKKDDHNIDATPVDKPTGEPRLVVQTRSEVDIVNDGYRWRKYGQKLVKGNPNPRSYYRCSTPGCPVKKHVERASHDPKVVITTYEGKHDHDMPPARTVTHNISTLDICSTAQNGEPATKSRESDASCLNMVVYNNGSGASGKSSEQPNGMSASKSEISDATGLDMVVHSNLDRQSKSNERQNGNSDTSEQSAANAVDTGVHPGSGTVGRSDEQSICESRTKSNHSNTASPGMLVYVTPGIGGNSNDQQTSNAEAICS